MRKIKPKRCRQCKEEFRKPISIDIKPLSVNRVWQGKRFKTGEYKDYEKHVLLLLPDDYLVPDGAIKLFLSVGFSSKRSDLDNIAKPFIDILQKKYSFDDCQIYALFMTKEIVKKGEEFIKFHIESLYE